MSAIKNLSYFACGSCKNHQEVLFKGAGKKEVIFPAGVFLIEHETLGYMLYDTGYNANVMGANLKYWLYRLPNPIKMTENQQIDKQLEARGISTDQIAYIFVSHLHPDHIGRLKVFKKAEFILTEPVYQTYRKPTFKDLVFKEYLPDNFEQRMRILDFEEKNDCLPGQFISDVFGDGSLLAISLDGHAKGQLCLFLEEKQLLIAADALWSVDMLDKVPRMRLIPKRIQDDFQAYKSNSLFLKHVMDKGIKVLVCHEGEEKVREILNA